MSRRLLLACALVALGCGPNNGTAVLLTLDGTMVDPAALAAVTELDFSSSGVETYQRSVTLGRPFSSSRRERILYQSKAHGGPLTIAVVARDAAGVERAGGSVQVTLRDGSTVSATLPLGPGLDDGGAPDGGSDGGVLVTPGAATVAVTRGVTFHASEPVTWSVAEPAGGEVDAQGRYFAPEAPGTYHVVATSVSDPGRTAEATVTATPLSLALVAGSVGGAGNLDGIATSARFNNPTGACGAYVADTGNHAIRFIDSFNNGRVSTVAGNGQPGDVDGVGAAAQLDAPAGLDCDSTQLYIADSGNGKIKKMLMSTNAVTTLAGGFINPADVALDAVNDRLFVADAQQARIYSIYLPSPTPVPIAGSGARGSTDNDNGLQASFLSPSRLALAGSQLYVVDGNLLRTVDVSPGGTAAVKTVPAQLGAPITAVGSGYVATSTALYDLTSVGASDAGAGPTLVAGDPMQAGVTDGNPPDLRFTFISYLSHDGFRVVDGNVVRELERGTPPKVTTLAGANRPPGRQDGVGAAASFLSVITLAPDDSGHVWLTDGAAIRSVELSTGTVTTLTVTPPSPSPAPIPEYQGLTWYGGALYLPSIGSQTLNRIDPTTGLTTIVAGQLGKAGYLDGAGTAAQFKNPGYVVSDGKGRLYISDIDNDAIRTFDVATGMVGTLAGTGTPGADDGVGTAASFSRPDTLALDGQGALYVADRGNDVVRRIDLASRQVSRFAGAFGQTGVTDGARLDARFQSPWGLACDGHSLFVTNLNALGVPAEPAVRRIDLVSGQVSHFVGAPPQQGITFGPLPAALDTLLSSGQMSLAVTPAGDLLVANGWNLLIVH